MTRAKKTSPEPFTVVTQYETLRSAALGSALSPEARVGFMLFLRRGLWGWARVMATASVRQPPNGSRPSNWKAPEEYRTMVHIFAAMALKTSHEGGTS